MLGFLQSLRQAIPASLDDSSQTRDAFTKFEENLITKANGATPEKRRRWAPSKKRK